MQVTQRDRKSGEAAGAMRILVFKLRLRFSRTANAHRWMVPASDSDCQ